jgi:hypothetical protein
MTVDPVRIEEANQEQKEPTLTSAEEYLNRKKNKGPPDHFRCSH